MHLKSAKIRLILADEGQLKGSSLLFTKLSKYLPACAPASAGASGATFSGTATLLPALIGVVLEMPGGALTPQMHQVDG